MKERERKIKEEELEKQLERQINGCLLIGLVGFLFLFVGWKLLVDYLVNEDFELISLDLESNIIDNDRSKGGYSNFIRIGFKSLDKAELDFDKFKTDELEESFYGIQIKILFKNGQFIKSQFELRGIQDGNDLIIKGSDLCKRWHSTKEREALINLSRETVKTVYIQIYEDFRFTYAPPEIYIEDDKRFTSFGIISRKEADDYNYMPKH